MKYSLDIRSEAEADIFEAAQYYNYQQSGLGFRFIEAIDRQMNRVLINPHMFPETEFSLIRRAVIPRFPYLLFYAVSD